MPAGGGTQLALTRPSTFMVNSKQIHNQCILSLPQGSYDEIISSKPRVIRNYFASNLQADKAHTHVKHETFERQT